MMQVVKTVIIISAVVGTHHHHHQFNHFSDHAHSVNKQDIIFATSNKKLEEVINQLFGSLNLQKQFNDEKKIQLLLTMLHDLNNISEKPYPMNDLLRKTATIAGDNKTIETINVFESVMDILDGNPWNVSNDNKHINVETRLEKEKYLEFNNTEDVTDLVRFINKRRELAPDALKIRSYNSKKEDFEVWKPPNGFNSNYTANRRVFGGHSTNIHAYPFIASVHLMGEFSCAGNIISKDLVLTAASCLEIDNSNNFFRKNPATTQVRVGSKWHSNHGHLIPVAHIYFHPFYNPENLKHNLAIVRLEKPLDFKGPQIKRIDLDFRQEVFSEDNNQVVLLGWGARKENDSVNKSHVLSVSVLDTYSLDECRDIYLSKYVNEDHFCAGFVSKPGGACNRDIGGPGIVTGLLTGVVSFGAPNCGAVDAPTVFTRVAGHLDWIVPIMKQQIPKIGQPNRNKGLKEQTITTTDRLVHSNPITTTQKPSGYFLRSSYKETPEDNLVTEDTVAAEEQPETNSSIGEIIYDLATKNESIINQLLNDNFEEYNVPSTESDLDMAHHPLINKTLHVIPGIHFEIDNRTFTYNTKETTEPPYDEWLFTYTFTPTPKGVLKINHPDTGETESAASTSYEYSDGNDDPTRDGKGNFSTQEYFGDENNDYYDDSKREKQQNIIESASTATWEDSEAKEYTDKYTSSKFENFTLAYFAKQKYPYFKNQTDDQPKQGYLDQQILVHDNKDQESLEHGYNITFKSTKSYYLPSDFEGYSKEKENKIITINTDLKENNAQIDWNEDKTIRKNVDKLKTSPKIYRYIENSASEYETSSDDGDSNFHEV